MPSPLEEYSLCQIPLHLIVQILAKMEGKSLFRVGLTCKPMGQFLRDTGIVANFRDYNLHLSYYNSNENNDLIWFLTADLSQNCILHRDMRQTELPFVLPSHFKEIRLLISDVPSPTSETLLRRRLNYDCDYLCASIPKDFIPMIESIKCRKIRIVDHKERRFGIGDVAHIIKNCEVVHLNLESPVTESFYATIRSMRSCELRTAELQTNIIFSVLTDIASGYRPVDNFKELSACITLGSNYSSSIPGFEQLFAGGIRTFETQKKSFPVAHNIVDALLKIVFKKAVGRFILASVQVHPDYRNFAMFPCHLNVRVLDSVEELFVQTSAFIFPLAPYDLSVYCNQFVNFEQSYWPDFLRFIFETYYPSC